MPGEVLRLYDPAREPPGWTAIVRPRQLVAFATNLESGAPCDATGRPFQTPSDMTCIVFDTLDDARRFCSDAVERVSSIQFDVFDAEGRVNPPLLQIVHPSRAAALEGDPKTIRTRKRAAFALLAAGLALIAYDAWFVGQLLLITMVGITLVLAAGRLLFVNLAFTEAERRRAERLARHERERSKERA